MSILFVLVPLSLALVLLGGWAFMWAVGNGQFDDLTSSSWDALADDAPPQAAQAHYRRPDNA